MQVDSTRFGRLNCGANDVLIFPEGVIGFEEMRLWTLLNDGSLAWLQSLENGSVALPVTNPFLYVPDYEVRLAPEDCQQLSFTAENRPLVLVVVNHVAKKWTLNLHAPILVCLKRRLGRQFVTLDEQPLRHVLSGTSGAVRKSA